MRIAFLYDEVAFGTHRAPLDFTDVEANGLTGTDAVCVHYARELAKRGHWVTVFAARAERSMPDDANEVIGLRIRPFSDWKDNADRFDVAIATGCPNALANATPGTLRIVNRQCARFGIDCVKGWEAFTDIVTCPSETARAFVSKGIVGPMFRVQPNGCYPDHFEGVAKIPGRCVYTSSPDRGLHLLLQAWPRIRRAVPHATLRIFYYSLHDWLNAHTNPAKPIGHPLDEECTRRAQYIRHAIVKLAKHGIEIIGGVDHRQLEREIAEAECFTYPCDTLAFTETFSVATLEACAAGAVPAISSADSLGQIYGGIAEVLEHPVRDRMGAYVDLVVRSLTDARFRDDVAARGRAFAAKHAWPELAAQLERMILAERSELASAITQRADTAIAPTPIDDVEGHAAITLGAAPQHAPITSAAQPSIHMVLSDYASGGVAIDIDATKDDSPGGSRAGFMGLVRALGRSGKYRVEAFSTFKNPGIRDGVAYRLPSHREKRPRPDVLFAYYDTRPIVGAGGCLRIASHHTFALPFHASVEWADVNTAPSDYARDALARVYGGTWRTLTNGLDIGDVPPRAPVDGRVLYHTSPDRGLHLLLEAWPKVRERLPHATLHVVGDVEGWLTNMRASASRQGDRARRVSAAIGGLAYGSVRFVGRLSRADLDRELAQASCFAFPCDPAMPCETFSISVMECLARGVPVVMAPADALGSVYDGHFIHASHDPARFADTVVETLRKIDAKHPVVNRWLESDVPFARGFTFDREAARLDAIIREELGESALDAFEAMTPARHRATRAVLEDHALNGFVSAPA